MTDTPDKNASPNDAPRPAETRAVPETGVWVRLFRPD